MRPQHSIAARLAAAALATGLACGVAVAQGSAPAPSPAPIPAPTEAQLDKYAGAVQKVSAIADEYRPKLDAARDDAAREAVLNEADAKMVQAVQADGMSVDEYNGISMAVRQDPQLRQRVVDKINAKSGGTR